MSVIERFTNLFAAGSDARYRCAECAATFETPRHGVEEARCPECGSPDIER